MDYEITLARPWRYRHRKRGWVAIDPGAYVVPEQIERYAAELAVQQGMATRRDVVRPKVAEPPAAPAKPKRGRSKGPAPENKTIPFAPENKAV